MLRICGVRFDLSTEATNVGVERSGVGQFRVIPKMINAFITSHDLARSFHEQLHEFEFFARQVNWGARDSKFTPGEIEDERPHF
jgi:hypothetical protein